MMSFFIILVVKFFCILSHYLISYVLDFTKTSQAELIRINSLCRMEVTISRVCA